MGGRVMTTVSVSPDVLVNQSYAMQRVTGQQRYANEIAQRLLQEDQFKPIGPTGFGPARPGGSGHGSSSCCPGWRADPSCCP